MVVPRALRDELGLKAGQRIEITVSDGRIEIEPVPTPVKLVKRGGVLVAQPEEPLPTLTAEEVRATLERLRR